MSEMKVTGCDGCAEMAPVGNSPINPSKGWVHLQVRFHEIDACSWECVATIVAGKVAECADADDRRRTQAGQAQHRHTSRLPFSGAQAARSS